MKMVANYQADFELTTLVIPRKNANGTNWMEPLWLKADDKSGLAVFASALDAEIYRQIANNADGRAWQRLPLAQFDLLAHLKDLGGLLHCQMIFGFGASLSDRMALRAGLPRPCLVPVTFEVGRAAIVPITFNFASWVSDFMRKQWTIAGAAQHADCLALINQETDEALSAMATRALSCIVRENNVLDHHAWCMYSPDMEKWLFAPDELRQHANLH